MNCRFCNNHLKSIFIDLGNSPPSNSFLTNEELNEPESYYPLKLYVCDNCFLVQIAEYKKSNEIFCEKYLYYSSYSSSWLEHSKKYSEMIIERLKLDHKSIVMEIASNDGYLLQYFHEKKIPCFGVEPASETAEEARKKGIEVIIDFFGTLLANQLKKEQRQADLIIGNNVLAHVPDINDFVEGLHIALKPDGAITLEFPHLMKLIEGNQFDTIYHEHYSYLSLQTVVKIFEKHNLTIFDVDELDTHGGSLRIYARRADNNAKPISRKVKELIKKEISAGMDNLEYYRSFHKKAWLIKNNLLSFLIEQKNNGKKIAAYGAAAKGNTLLNYCGIRDDLIQFVVDLSPHKQGKYLPGSHIPVLSPDALTEYRPDYMLILPWNIADEVILQHDYVKDWGCKIVMAIPTLKVLL